MKLLSLLATSSTMINVQGVKVQPKAKNMLRNPKRVLVLLCGSDCEPDRRIPLDMSHCDLELLYIY